MTATATMTTTERLARARARIVERADVEMAASVKRLRCMRCVSDRVAEIEASDAAYAVACRQARFLDPMCSEFHSESPGFHGTGVLSSATAARLEAFDAHL